MTQSEQNQVPTLLKVGMYSIELIILNVVFYLIYSTKLSGSAEGLYSSAYGYMAMSLSMAYCVGVAVRPMAFFLRSDRKGTIIGNVAVAVSIMAAAFLLFVAAIKRSNDFMSWRIILMFLSLFVLLVVWRYICRSTIYYLRSNGRNARRIIFVGYNDTLLELNNEFRNSFYGYKVLGWFCDEEPAEAPEGFTHLGKVADIERYLEQHPEVHQLYCSLPSIRATEIRAIVRACDHHCVRFFSVPQVRNYLKRQMQMEIVGAVPVLYMHEDPLSSLSNRMLKRTFDIVVSGLFLIPFWVLIYPVIAILTKILQPGPVFFKQKRNGLNGEEFLCYKFRSMKVNADADRLQATKDDPRKTPFGNFLRKSSIDELPQFINVFKGDMSIVGPRPHMVAHTEEYSALIDKYMVRHWVKPGITGWAQVRGARGETKELWQMEDRIRKDIWYIENWTLFLDIKIMFLTIRNAIGGDKQAY